MKRTHKLPALGDVQTVVDAAPDLHRAAQRLGINRSTLTRWIQQGKVKRPGSLPSVGTVTVPERAEGWKAGVLAEHILTDTERTLVDVADAALRLARDQETPAFTKLSAMGRFAAIVKQLNLDVKRIDAEKKPQAFTAPTVANGRPRRMAGDPRAVLMAVK